MKQTKLTLSLAVVATISAMFFAITGCEKDGDTGSGLDAWFAANPYVSDPRTSTSSQKLSMSPAAATVTTVGQKINFYVTGGSAPYTWDVAISGAGSVARQTDTQYGIYTAASISKNNVIAVDADGSAAIGNIEVAVTTLSISPGSVFVCPAGAGSTTIPAAATFTASGGTPPYAWSRTYASISTLSATSGSSTIYTATGSNTNITDTITLTDSDGNIATASAVHFYAP